HGRSAAERARVPGAIERAACPAKNGNRRDSEGSYPHRRTILKGTPIHGDVPAPAADIFPAVMPSFLSWRNSIWTRRKIGYRASRGLVRMSDERTRDSYKSGRSLRILVVEDHSETLDALSRLLSHFGHEISVADGAQVALNMIDSKEFDVVLCDIALPDGNGY